MAIVKEIYQSKDENVYAFLLWVMFLGLFILKGAQ